MTEITIQLGEEINLQAVLDAIEARVIQAAIETKGTHAGAARLLGMNRTTLIHKARRFGILRDKKALEASLC